MIVQGGDESNAYLGIGNKSEKFNSNEEMSAEKLNSLSKRINDLNQANIGAKQISVDPILIALGSQFTLYKVITGTDLQVSGFISYDITVQAFDEDFVVTGSILNRKSISVMGTNDIVMDITLDDTVDQSTPYSVLIGRAKSDGLKTMGNGTGARPPNLDTSTWIRELETEGVYFPNCLTFTNLLTYIGVGGSTISAADWEARALSFDRHGRLFRVEDETNYTDEAPE